MKTVNVHSRAIADVFTKMVDERIVRPLERDGLPPESFPRVAAAVQALRPLAVDVVLASFRRNMDESAEDAFGKILTRIAREEVKPASDSKADSAKSRASAKSSGSSAREQPKATRRRGRRHSV